MKTIAFFNNKGGVGKTSLVYHLAWMFADRGLSVLAVDLDPQANLTAMFLDEERLENLWPDAGERKTIFGAIQPLLEGTGDIADPHVEEIDGRLGLLVGDLKLSSFEDELSAQWPNCLDGKPRAFRVIASFWRAIERAALEREATAVLIDVGPNLGAINRAAMVAAEHVVIPLAPDLYSLQGLRNLGPSLRRWRSEWSARLGKRPLDLALPPGRMTPAGYIVMQHAVRLDRPVKAYSKWMARVPGVYRESVLDGDPMGTVEVQKDPHCLALLKHYRSLMPLAQEAHKPMFFLKAADGAIGSHAAAAADCYDDFKLLAERVAARAGIGLS